MPIKERQIYRMIKKFVKATNPPPLPNAWGPVENHVVEHAAAFDNFAERATETGESLDPSAVAAHLKAKKLCDGQFQCNHQHYLAGVLYVAVIVDALIVDALIDVLVVKCRNLAQCPDSTQVHYFWEYSENIIESV